MKQISTFNTKKDRTSLLFYMIFIIGGIGAGAFLSGKSQLSASVWINQQLFTRTFSMRDSLNTLVSLFLYLGAAFLTGLFAFGRPCGLALLVYRGIGIGVSAGLMYVMYGRGAVVPVIITFLPRAASAAFIAAVSIRESARNSRSILAFCMNRYDSGESSISFKLYCLRYIVLFIFSIFISAADGAVLYLYGSVRR